MAINSGKRFEANFKASVPEGHFYYRFRDGTANFSGNKNENVRFQQKNMCDCMIYNRETKELFFLELKSHKGKSIPFNCIRDNQIEQLEKVEDYGINGGFVFFYQDLEETYYVRSHLLSWYLKESDRKSIPIDWCRENCYKIPAKKLKTNYRYDLSGLLNFPGS